MPGYLIDGGYPGVGKQQAKKPTSTTGGTCHDLVVTESELPMLDLERWDSVAEAVAQLSMGSRAFEEALFPFLDLNQREADGAITMFSLFVMSTASRARGFHEAIIREIQNENPHAVFPIMRSLLEKSRARLLRLRASEIRNGRCGTSQRPDSWDTNRKSPQALVDCMEHQAHTGQSAT